LKVEGGYSLKAFSKVSKVKIMMDPAIKSRTVRIHSNGDIINLSCRVRIITTQTPKHSDRINLLPALKVIRLEHLLQFHLSQISLNKIVPA
jgi:hypothetical protein